MPGARRCSLEAGAASGRQGGRGSYLLESGERVALLGYGYGVTVARDAAEVLAGHDLRPTVADARFAKPIDTELLERLALGHDLIVTIEEGVLPGGFGSAALEHLEDAFSDRPEERARLLLHRGLGGRARSRRVALRATGIAVTVEGACTKALNRLACAGLLKAEKHFR